MANTRKNIEIGKILFKYVKGEANSEEIAEIHEWLKEDGNREFLEELRYSRKISKGIEQIRKINTDKYDAQFDKKVAKINGKRNIRSFLAYAAMLAIIMSVGIFVFKNNNSKDVIKVVLNNPEAIKPGMNKATLITSEGEKYVLGKNSGGELIKDNKGKLLKASDDSLVYKVSNVEISPVSKAKYNTLVVPKNGEFILTLSDGSKVWINSDSKLIYPDEFIGKERLVYLEGEAYFEVSKDAKKPFLVKTQDAKIKVLGTGFNIKNYKDDIHATTLVHGKVEVETSFSKKVVLTPGHQAIINDSNLEVKEVDVRYAIAWKEGYFMFLNENLDHIMKELARWYDFEYFFQNSSASKEVFTSKIKRFDDFDNVLNILQATNKIKFKKKGKLVIVKAK